MGGRVEGAGLHQKHIYEAENDGGQIFLRYSVT